MSIITKAIPSFFGGVSQQSAVSRHETQVEIMRNADPSIAEGLGKRAPTEHIKAIEGSEDAFIHFINRDAAERYVVVIEDESIKVFDLEGTEQTVLTPDGVGYLASTTPREEFATITVADYTFIVNKTVVAAMDSAVGGGSLTGTVQQFSELPEEPSQGVIYKIEGTPTTQFDDYYVEYNGSVWVERVKPGIQNSFDATTLPHQLIKTGPNTFTFQKATWASRLVGDEDSNPVPSFIGKTISDVFFHRNRLGFVSDENVIMSRAGDPFNFWAETVTAVLDSDPIDAGATTNKVSILHHAQPFNKALMLFSSGTQFQLSGGDVLTPSSAKLDPTTEFESSHIARPASAGSSLFFAVPREHSTGLREYYVDQDTISNDAADITAHCPSYIPTGVFKLTASTTKDSLLVLSTEERNKAWVYRFYWSGNEKVQSAWHEWDLGDDAVVLGAEFFGSVLYLVIMRDSTTYLERMTLDRNLEDADLGFRALLDRRVTLTGTYDSGTNLTTWTLPYEDEGDIVVVLGSDFGVHSGTSLNTTRPSSSEIAAVGDWTAGSCIVGRTYEMRVRLSRLHIKDDKGAATVCGRLTIQCMHVWLENTGYLRAEVTVGDRDPSIYEFTGKTIGTYSLGSMSITDGDFTFPCLGKNTEVTIDLINDNYLPCNIIMAEWDANYESRKQRL